MLSEIGDRRIQFLRKPQPCANDQIMSLSS
jgi:hypothetical protein